MLPDKYKWLTKEPGPKMLISALSLFGVAEIPGKRNNPIILSWAKRLKVDNIYTADEIAWCGLFMAVVATNADKQVPQQFLWALNWLKFGAPVTIAMLGDVLIFKRESGGHVGLYVGEDKGYYHVLGGNTGDCVAITRINKSRLAGIRRPKYNDQPDNVRVIKLDADGIISTDEK